MRVDNYYSKIQVKIVNVQDADSENIINKLLNDGFTKKETLGTKIIFERSLASLRISLANTYHLIKTAKKENDQDDVKMYQDSYKDDMKRLERWEKELKESLRD